MKTEICEYPSIDEVCGLMDSTVLHDITGEEPARILYYIGQPADSSAGLFSFEATPMYTSKAELEGFCKTNIDKFKELSEMESYPDKLFWEK